MVQLASSPCTEYDARGLVRTAAQTCASLRPRNRTRKPRGFTPRHRLPLLRRRTLSAPHRPHLQRNPAKDLRLGCFI